MKISPMGKIKNILAMMLMGVLLLVSFNSLSFDNKKHAFSIAPSTNNGNKWRIAYYEGGPHDNYYYYLVATMNGLIDLGWIEPIIIPDQPDNDTKKLWEWLSNNGKSNYIEFVEDAYYGANWDSVLREKLRNTIITRINRDKDINLILAMGSWAGKDLANNEHSIPYPSYVK